MTLNTRKLAIKTFEAIRDMASCLDFSEGYFKILSEQGMSSSYLSSHTWMQTDGIHGVLAMHEGSVIGGIILCVPGRRKKFPYEDLIEPSMKSTKNRLFKQPARTGELFALWHSNSAAGWGVSYILLKAGLALSSKLGIKKTLFLAAEYNMRLIDKLGFQPEMKDRMPVFYTFQEASLNTKIYLNHFLADDDRFARSQKEEIRELANSGFCHKLESVLGKKLEIDYHI